MSTAVTDYLPRLEDLAHRLGLEYRSIDFEVVPPSFMMEVAVYGLPVRMSHWSFGVRYIHQLIRRSLGQSRIFEVMFPGDPCHAYLVTSNTPAENALVIAHVIGHADFVLNNQLFARYEQMAGTHIVEHAAAQAHRIDAAIAECGRDRVEAVLDAALALEAHVDTTMELHRPPYRMVPEPDTEVPARGVFRERYGALPGERRDAPAAKNRMALPMPPRPEYDLLWFIANHVPDMEDWERDVFLAVREEALYFYPVFACQIMNEGWATYWHARLLREADFLPENIYLDAIKAHSEVVRPLASGETAALGINPYHLGFTMWESIVEKMGLEEARRIRCEEDDSGFVRNYLSRELADKLQMFVFDAGADGEVRVATRDIGRLHEAILAPRFNYGVPRICVSELRHDGTLVLQHDHAGDGRGLDLDRAERVARYVRRVSRRPVIVKTCDARGASCEVTALEDHPRNG